MKKALKQIDELLLSQNKNHKNFLSDIKERLKRAQIRAALAVNSELINFYWELGTDLIEKQKAFEWGERFLEQFSHDMRKAFPEMQGFSVTTLKRMRLFAQEYPDFKKGAQAVHQLPWGHIVVLIHRVREKIEREWYAQETTKNGWSRSILEMQIKSRLYERQGVLAKKVSNYHQHLPPSQSDLANEILKDPYNFDFLTIQNPAHERAVEDGLVAHIRDFLLELGQGFAFVGSQVPLTIDDQEFFIDLLFYHIRLRCYIVIELKATKFKPEHTGQLGFYLAAVDNRLKNEGDNKTIGILLCESKSKIIAEYALQNSKAPIGVSEYILMKSLPTDLKTNLPTVEQIEAELNDVLETQRGDIILTQDDKPIAV